MPARSLPDPEMHAAVHLVWREFSLFPALFHEIFNEPVHDAVLDDLVAWLRATLAPTR